jgi:radical SAM protein with 4Fe4S-binding SPASM domain
MGKFRLYPANAVWEITFLCNMRCLHCGTAAGEKREDELTTKEALQLIDDLADLDCDFMTLSGGEPLLRRDWRELASRLKERKVRLGIVTNGWSVTGKIAQDFKDLEFDMVGVSFDGTEKTHDYIRQTPGSYKRAYRALQLVNQTGVKNCALTQVSRLNIEELDKIYQDLLSIATPLWRIQMTTHTGRMCESGGGALVPEDMPGLARKILEIRDEKKIKIDVGENIGYYGDLGDNLWFGHAYLGCYAGCRVIGIESNGNIKGCLSMPEDYVEGNIRERPLKEIWDDMSLFSYNRQFSPDKVTGFCKECPHLKFCRCGCSTTAIGATGTRFENPYCLYRLEVEEKQKKEESVSSKSGSDEQ